MKTIHEKLCSIISSLDVIFQALSFLMKEVEIAPSPLTVDNYFKFLQASERIRETIEILERIIKRSMKNYAA